MSAGETASVVQTDEPEPRGLSTRSLLRFLSQREIILIILLIALTILVRAAGASGFMGPNHFPIFLTQVAPDVLMLIPMAMLLIGGTFDLSVTGIANLSVVIIGYSFTKLSGSLPDVPLVLLMIALGLLAGAIVGFINGLAVTRIKMNPLMTTLATWWMAQGVATGIAGGESRSDFVGLFSEIARFQPLQPLGKAIPFLEEARISTIPIVVFYALAVILVGWIVMSKTRFGWHVYATGSDRRGAALNGIRVRRVTMIGFICTGLGAAFTGVIWASRLGSAPPNALSGLELRVIAASVIGGAALSGGEGSIPGAVLGLFFMHMIRSATIQLGLPVYWELFILGAVLFASVVLDAATRKRSELERF